MEARRTPGVSHDVRLSKAQEIVAWHGSAVLKAEVVARMRSHRDLGGMLLWPDEAEARYGLLADVMHILVDVSHKLPSDDGADFAVASMEAIRAGADLRTVPDEIMLDVLSAPGHGLLDTLCQGSTERAIVSTITRLYERELAGGSPARAEWESACESAQRHDLSRIVCDAAWIGGRTYYTNDLYAAAIGSITGNVDYWGWLAGRIVLHLSEV